MNIPQKCNNPLNLKIRAPIGEAIDVYAIGPDGLGYAVFPQGTVHGWHAARRQIEADQKRGLSLRNYIFKFAPPNENNTNAYLDFVVRELGVNPGILLKNISKWALMGVQAAFEGYFAEEEHP